MGWQVSEAANGTVALMALADKRPDLIMLDLVMPITGGFEFLVEVRARAQWRDIPVVVVTAKDLTTEERNRLNGSVTRVLQNNAVELDELLSEIRHILPGMIARGRNDNAIAKIG